MDNDELERNIRSMECANAIRDKVNAERRKRPLDDRIYETLLVTLYAARTGVYPRSERGQEEFAKRAAAYTANDAFQNAVVHTAYSQILLDIELGEIPGSPTDNPVPPTRTVIVHGDPNKDVDIGD